MSGMFVRLLSYLIYFTLLPVRRVPKSYYSKHSSIQVNTASYWLIRLVRENYFKEKCKEN